MDMTLLWEHVCLFVLFFWYVGPQNEKQIFSFLKKIIKSQIFLKPIVSSLLSFSCKTASINIYVQSTSEIYDVICIIFFFFNSAQYAKKNGLTQKKRMLAILGVSVAVMFLLIVSVVYCFVMKKKKGKEVVRF